MLALPQSLRAKRSNLSSEFQREKEGLFRFPGIPPISVTQKAGLRRSAPRYDYGSFSLDTLGR